MSLVATVSDYTYLQLNVELTGVKTAYLQVLDMVQSCCKTLENHLTSLSLHIYYSQFLYGDDKSTYLQKFWGH